MHRLVSPPGSPHAWEIHLKPGIHSIGRGPDNDVRIDDPSISTAHCQLVIKMDAIRIVDRHSTNGTFIDNAKVQEALLHPGQLLRLGAVELRLEEDNTEAERAPVSGAFPTPVT
ncbi:MAG TPA: FHA domain-containing protein, partial [Bacillota bacterium]|nr:FHA domain-containing protein [Bacillota bacterium]